MIFCIVFHVEQYYRSAGLSVTAARAARRPLRPGACGGGACGFRRCRCPQRQRRPPTVPRRSARPCGRGQRGDVARRIAPTSTATQPPPAPPCHCWPPFWVVAGG